MTDRTPYFEAYYQAHSASINNRAKTAYRHRLHVANQPGSERIAPGLSRIWYKGEVIGEVEYIPVGQWYQCEVGKFKTKRAAMDALVKGLEDKV
jgi:hypothetical protein